MSSSPETLLVGRIRKALTAFLPGCYIVKLAGGPYQQAGLPDLLVVYGGRVLVLEVKCPRPGESEQAARGRVTDQQRASLDRFDQAGAQASVVISVDQALAVAKRYYFGGML